jgi:putative tryptophan/tyrosine transport system substrate-binding protein
MQFDQLKRRDLFTLLGGATAWPLAGDAAEAVPVIAHLYVGTPNGGAVRLAAFRNGLSEAGFVEGRNLAVEYRFVTNNRIPEAVDDLVRRRVAALVVSPAAQAVIAAKSATTTIPIIYYSGIDPIEAGIVASLNRPGGNVTGISSMNNEIMPKRLGLLNELLPAAKRFGLFVNRNEISEPMVKAVQSAASSVKRQIEVFELSDNPEIDISFQSAAQMQLDGVLITASPLFGNRRAQIVALAMRYRIPVIYYDRIFVETGGLMSYGPDVDDEYRQLGLYTARVLKGEKPGDLPVMQPTKFELIMSLHTAKLLDLEIPPTLLARADTVIE